MEPQVKRSPSAYRHYCCICSNFGGKVVADKPVSLHRFPADKKLQKAWLARIKIVSPSFHWSEKNDRVCSAHFKNGLYDRKLNTNNVPSIFVLSDGRTKTFSDTKTIKNVSCTSSSMEVDDCDKPEVYTNWSFTNSGSTEKVSVMLHDYCGHVSDHSISNYLDKSVQSSYSKVIEAVEVQTDNPLHSTVGTQTEFQHPEVHVCTCQTKQTSSVSVGIQVVKPDFTVEDVKSDENCMFYTGLPNMKTFHLLFDEMNDADKHTHRYGDGTRQGRPRVLRLIDEFFLVLMRLRLGLLLEDLAQRFHISKSTCSNITSRWISYLCVKLNFLTAWPTKSTIITTMPNKFKRRYPTCRVIIDCTEIYTETPQSLSNKSLMYSHYKCHMTYKALLGISPSGLITFTSDLYAGSVSDKQLTMKCGLLDLCTEGDAIMADKGFLISDLTTPRGIKLIIPPLKHKRFNKREVEETRRIANLRIDVERAMERVKNFRILQGVMPINLSSQATQIWKICVSLSNLLPPLVHDEDD